MSLAKIRKEAAEAEAALLAMREPTPNATDATPPAPATPQPQGGDAPPTQQRSIESPTDDQWEQRYRTLQGMFAKTNDQNAELRGRIDELSNQMRQLKPAHHEQPSVPQQKARLITEDELKDYGAEFIDVTRRAAREEFQDLITELQSKVEKLTHNQTVLASESSHTAKVAAETLEDKYFSALDAGLPEWQNINTSQKFLTWLDEVDNFTGVSRQVLLNQAFAAKDSRRTLNFFKAFKDAHNGTAVNTPAPSVDPASLISPESVSSGAPVGSSKRGKIWSQADVEKVYEDRVRGRSTPEQFIEREKEVMQAIAEGRIK